MNPPAPTAGELLANELLAIPDIETEEVIIPEWKNKSLRVRGLTGKERDEFESHFVRAKDKGRPVTLENIRARLVQMSVVDSKGNLVFEPGHINALGGKSAKALDRIFDVAQRLSGLRKEDVEELKKNSSEAPNESAGSESPAS